MKTGLRVAASTALNIHSTMYIYNSTGLIHYILFVVTDITEESCKHDLKNVNMVGYVDMIAKTQDTKDNDETHNNGPDDNNRLLDYPDTSVATFY